MYRRLLLTLARRLYGAPPPRSAPPAERLRWLRRLYLRSLPLLVLPVVLIAIGGASTGVWVAVAAGALFWLQGFASVLLRPRRERG